MSDIMKAALIVGGAVLLATIIALYFSPYHSCVRSGPEENRAWALNCARAVGGSD